MVFDARIHCDLLHSLKSYLPSVNFLASYGWNQDGSANVLVDKQNKETAVVVVVGKVVHDRVYCGPSGNWSSNNAYGSLKAAKYQFTICCPDEEIFANDFDVAFKTLGKIQAAVASTSDRRNLLVGEADKINNIKFSGPVFEERERVSVKCEYIYIYRWLKNQSLSRSSCLLALAHHRKPSSGWGLILCICLTLLQPLLLTLWRGPLHLTIPLKTTLAMALVVLPFFFGFFFGPRTTSNTYVVCF